MCNLHWCYTFCTGVTLFALVLHLNCTALSQSESSNFFMYIISANIPTKAILFFFGCSEANSTWLITSRLANQRARKVLFTCVVYTNHIYGEKIKVLLLLLLLLL